MFNSSLYCSYTIYHSKNDALGNFYSTKKKNSSRLFIRHSFIHIPFIHIDDFLLKISFYFIHKVDISIWISRHSPVVNLFTLIFHLSIFFFPVPKLFNIDFGNENKTNICTMSIFFDLILNNHHLVGVKSGNSDYLARINRIKLIDWSKTNYSS